MNKDWIKYTLANGTGLFIAFLLIEKFLLHKSFTVDYVVFLFCSAMIVGYIYQKVYGWRKNKK